MSQMHTTPELAWTQLDRLHKSLRVGGHNATTLAAALGVHRNTINNYLAGRSTPDRRTLIAWALTTGVPMAWLEDGTMPESPTPPTDGQPGGDAVTQLAEKKRGRGTGATGRYFLGGVAA